MRRICSWCGETLESGSAFPLLTTHGVCAECAQKLLTSISDSSRKALALRAAKPLEVSHSSMSDQPNSINAPSTRNNPSIERRIAK